MKLIKHTKVEITSKSSYLPLGSDTDKTNSVVSELTSITAINYVNKLIFINKRQVMIKSTIDI